MVNWINVVTKLLLNTFQNQTDLFYYILGIKTQNFEA
jgi:hypothetical protein